MALAVTSGSGSGLSGSVDSGVCESRARSEVSVSA